MTTLVCLPFAGAGASFYRPWTSVAGNALEIVAVQLPGRERLLDEEPHRDVHDAVAALVPALRDRIGAGRVAFFGHSLGAVLAYEFAHAFAAFADVEVTGLFVSGSPGPRTQRERKATGLSDDEFLSRVQEFAGYSHAALADPEMREMVLPTLRADVRMHEYYQPSTPRPLAAPITALRGEDDGLVSAEQAAEWAGATTAGFTTVELPGGHMYLTGSAEPVLRVINDRLGACTGHPSDEMEKPCG